MRDHKGVRTPMSIIIETTEHQDLHGRTAVRALNLRLPRGPIYDSWPKSAGKSTTHENASGLTACDCGNIRSTARNCPRKTDRHLDRIAHDRKSSYYGNLTAREKLKITVS
jgi:ABC-type uncharacterized transport system ATPase subunit